MTLFYIFALIPVFIGLFIWIKSHEVVWQEWLIACVCAFLVAGIMHTAVVKSLTGDVETWSGKVTAVEHHPRWVEQYQQMHTRQVASGTDSKGNTTYTTEIYYTTEYDTHPEHWEARLDFGSETKNKDISLEYFSQIKVEFGGLVEDGGKQRTSHAGFRVSGDQNIYLTRNKTGFFRPVTQIKSFENRIKAAPSVFSFAPPPTNAPIFQYPANNDLFVSDRLLGVAQYHVKSFEWDSLNSRLGPTKLVNLILVGFKGGSSELSQFQEALWVGGKKNDVVLTYGIEGSKVTWTRVFGWTESDVCKRNLESILLKGINQTNLIQQIEKEVSNNYKLKDWKKFDYLRVEPKGYHFGIFFGAMIVTQIGLYIYFHKNEYSKGGYYGYRRRY